MASDFSDLWSSSAPKTKAPTLGTATSTHSAQSTRLNGQKSAMGYGKPDVFALLASSSTAATNRNGLSSASLLPQSGSINTSRIGTPTLPSQGSRTSTPSLRTPGSTASGGSMDAFSDLFAGSATSKNTNMTLADRLAQEQKERTAGMGTMGRGGPSSSVSNTSAPQASPSDAWAGLDSLAGGSLGLGAGLQPKPAASSTSILRPGHMTSVPTTADDDDWGLGDFGSASTAKPTRAAATPVAAPSKPAVSSSSSLSSKPKTLWDLDDFTAPSPVAASTSSRIRSTPTAQSVSRTGSAQSYNKPKPQADDFGIFHSPEDDFDFGNRENGYQQPGKGKAGRGGGLLDFDEDDDDDERGDIFLTDERSPRRGGDDDDILGMLAKPVEEVKTTTRTPAASGSHRRPSPPHSNTPRAQLGRAPSPPPHLIGQLVEMGFPVVDARTALLITMKADGTGFDVTAAAENLLGGQSANTHDVSSVRREERPPQRHVEDAPRGPPKGRREREREREERERRKQKEQDGDDVVTDIQLQADKLLAQASEIGLSVFSKASAFWKEGKEKVVKVYEERAATTDVPQRAPRGGGRTDGRPKWMVRDDDEHDKEEIFDSGFKDDRSPPNSATEMFGERGPPRRADKARRPSPPPHQRAQPAQEPEIDLFAASGPVPSSSRAPPPNRRTQAPSRTSSFASTQAPPPPPSRSLVAAPSSSTSSALRHRNSGTDAFKLGQFGAAVEAYTLAIQSLPVGHLLLVPLYNNRALARLKTGEHKAAAEDAGRVISLVIGETVAEESFDPTAGDAAANCAKAGSWTPASEHPSILQAAQAKANGGGWEHPQGLGVDLVDGFVKAVKRRAEAWEGREKWKEAGRDWELLAGSMWVGESVKKEAVRGAGRCRNMASGGNSAGSSTNGGFGGLSGAATSRAAVRPKPKPKPKPVPVPTSNEPSAALLAHQETTRQAEEEDTQKHVLKDAVDAKVAAWRTGKETNIRALLASLDLVLWEELLKGIKVGGLGELVTPAQVKKGYVKAIARVHPDKLNASNSTLEQRMLANNVFGTLNEAWIAFQATQK